MNVERWRNRGHSAIANVEFWNGDTDEVKKAHAVVNKLADRVEELQEALEEVVDHPMVQHYVNEDVRRRWEALVPEENA